MIKFIQNGKRYQPCQSCDLSLGLLGFFCILLLCTYIFVPHESRTFDDCWCMTYSKNVLRNLMQNNSPRIVNDGPYLVSDDSEQSLKKLIYCVRLSYSYFM